MTTLEFTYALQSSTKSLKPFAMKLTKDYDDANDLLQDTMVKAFLNQDKYTEGTNLKAWLYTIMRNTFITNYQKMIRKNTFIDHTDSLHHLNSSVTSLENEAYSHFALEDIQAAVDTLEASYRHPFRMYFEGFKYSEIAKTLKIPIGTVKNRIHIARKELKQSLQVYSFVKTMN
jgi:RNA polymerase sigma factor (sigma-70 family)